MHILITIMLNLKISSIIIYVFIIFLETSSKFDIIAYRKINNI